MLAGPFDFDSVGARLGRIVFTENRSLLRVVARHLHTECAFRSANSHGQLSGSGAFRFTYKAALEQRQHSVLDARTVDTNLTCIWLRSVGLR